MAEKPRILCLDGGGIRGLSEVLILKELMLQVRIQNGLDTTPEPRQCFDFICGTSTGGLLAVLLGRLDCTLDECEALYREFGSEIFSGGSLQKLFTGSKHASDGLAKIVRQKAGEQMMYEADSVENRHVPVAVVAVSRSTRDDYLFRTYGVRSSVEPCSIVDACLATSAATTFFPPVTINGVEYVDGAFQKNNPSSAAISEVESDEWPSPIRNAVAEVTCLVSIGTGRGSFEYKRSSLRDMFVPKGLVSMKEAAKMCVAITMDCHKEHLNVRSRFEKAGRIESYYRFNVDNGLEKIELDESDGKAQQHLSAVTKSYLTREATQLKRCASLISPKRATNVTAARSSFPGLLCSSIPDITDEFVGRESEIHQLRESLDPGQPGRRSVLLCGMGGTGKTQLALRHIWAERARYSAIVWINLWTSHHSNISLREAHDTMNSSWPLDLPITHRNGEGDTNALARVVARLRSTRYRNWLLVLDSAENLDQAGLAKYIPSCPHGSVLVTSTRRHAFSGSHPLQVINLDGLDAKTSTSLLLKLAHCPSLSESNVSLTQTLETIAAKTIAKELGGIPLALEQAAGLIREGEFSFSTFLGQYRNEYRRLMAANPSDELWSYDKNRVILTILDMAHRSLDSECAILLEYIGVLGSWPIPLSVLEQSLFVDDQANSAPRDVVRLRKILSEPHYLRLSLRRLAKFCLIRLKEVNGLIESVTIHRVLCS
ncbi:regulatory protein NB-ARC [Ilyonectria robusta]